MPNKGPTSEIIINATAQYFDIASEELVSTSRHKPLAVARRLAAYLLKADTNLRDRHIGAILHRDRTWAFRARQSISKTLPRNLALGDILTGIRALYSKKRAS